MSGLNGFVLYYVAALHTRDAMAQCTGRFSFQMSSHKYTAAIAHRALYSMNTYAAAAALEKCMFLLRRRR